MSKGLSRRSDILGPVVVTMTVGCFSRGTVLLFLLLLAALYVGATGIFMAARAELRIGISHTASSQAFHITQAGLATWANSSVQPALASYSIGGTTVDVVATKLLVVDSVTTLYRVVARATVGGTDERNPGLATRQTSLVARRNGVGPVVAVTGSWRENF